MTASYHRTHALPNEVARFYDDRIKRQLRDYVRGNARIAAAANRVCSAIREDHRTVLDVGCGIGMAAARYKERCPWIQVCGVDISKKNIEVATQLFPDAAMTFVISDMEEAPDGVPYDVVALVDVYEHIPRASWPQFNEVLANCISPSGVLVLTTPSPLHQEYLAANRPEELQIVDETVQLEDVLALHRAIGGSLTTYEYVNIWNTNDYLHVVIDRHPLLRRKPKRVVENRSVCEKIWSKVVDVRRLDLRKRESYVHRMLGNEIDNSQH